MMASETKTFNVEGMSCMHCVNAIRNSVKTLPGIIKVDVDMAGKKVAVEHESDKVNIEKIKDKIQDAGYEVV